MGCPPVEKSDRPVGGGLTSSLGHNTRHTQTVGSWQDTPPGCALPFSGSAPVGIENQLVQVRVYFDGGCSPNPGEGYGSYEVVSPLPSLLHKCSRQRYGHMTNNMAEWNALLCALEWLEDRPNREAMCLSIYTDSKLVCGQLGRGWRCKVWYLKELRDQCRALLKPFRRWSIEWHPRQENVKRFGH